MDVVSLDEIPWSKRNRVVGDSAEAEEATVRGAVLQASRVPWPELSSDQIEVCCVSDRCFGLVYSEAERYKPPLPSDQASSRNSSGGLSAQSGVGFAPSTVARHMLYLCPPCRCASHSTTPSALVASSEP